MEGKDHFFQLTGNTPLVPPRMLVSALATGTHYWLFVQQDPGCFSAKLLSIQLLTRTTVCTGSWGCFPQAQGSAFPLNLHEVPVHQGPSEWQQSHMLQQLLTADLCDLYSCWGCTLLHHPSKHLEQPIFPRRIPSFAIHRLFEPIFSLLPRLRSNNVQNALAIGITARIIQCYFDEK